MSNHLTSIAYKRDLGSLTKKAVIVLMADKASDDGSGIWASKQRMADELCVTKQTVINTIKALEADGIIAETGKRKCTNGFTVEYAINVRALESLPLVKWHGDQSKTLTGQTDSPVNEVDGYQSKTLTPPVNVVDPNPPEPPLEPPKVKSSGDDALRPEHVVEHWNSMAARNGLPVIRKLTPERRRKLQARIRDHPLDDWIEVFDHIEGSKFLRGQNGRGWTANFDFLLQPSSFVKILEGTYDRA